MDGPTRNQGHSFFEYQEITALHKLLRSTGYAAKPGQVAAELENRCWTFYSEWKELEGRPSKLNMLICTFVRRQESECPDSKRSELISEVLSSIKNDRDEARSLLAELIVDLNEIWVQGTTQEMPPIPTGQGMSQWTFSYRRFHPLCLMLAAVDAEANTTDINKGLEIVRRGGGRDLVKRRLFKYMKSGELEVAEND